MKCFVSFKITWALVASYPLDNQAQDEDRDDGKDLETRSSYIPELYIPDIPDIYIPDIHTYIPEPYISSIYRRRHKHKSKGNNVGNVGQEGINKGKVDVGNQVNSKRQMSFGATAGNVGQQGTNSGNVAVGHQLNGKRQMSFGATGGNVGQQGTNSGNVGVGIQANGRK